MYRMCFDSSIDSLDKHSIQCIACFDLCIDSVNKHRYYTQCTIVVLWSFVSDHLDMPFNVHTTDKVTMITVSGFRTI